MVFKEIQLLSHDFDATQYFYTEILQCPLTSQTNWSIGFQVGNTLLTFLHTDISAHYHFAFRIPPHLFSSSYEWVKQRLQVLPFTSDSEIADFNNWNAKAFYFHDPNGNILEFISHYDFEEKKDGPFTSTAIEGINEIGIPVESVKEACEDFKSKYGIPYFHKGPCMDDFCVMGNEEGLLIVTKEGRGWLPTSEPAERYPMNLKAVHEKMEFEINM
jgi:catechol 2,3-dioxygenase-like lactoylglutathione lyase family enzyme